MVAFLILAGQLFVLWDGEQVLENGRTKSTATTVTKSTMVTSITKPVIPVIEQNQPDFYGALGQNVKLFFDVDQNKLTGKSNLTLKLRVENLLNGEQVDIPDLQNKPEWNTLFVFGQQGKKIVSENGETVFEYTVTPKNSEELKLPSLRFLFWNPGAGHGKQMQVAYSSAGRIQIQNGSKIDIDHKKSGIGYPKSALRWSIPYYGWLAVPCVILLGYLLQQIISPKIAKFKFDREKNIAMNALKAMETQAKSYTSEKVFEIVSHFDTKTNYKLDMQILNQLSDIHRFSPEREKLPLLIEEARQLILAAKCE